MLLCLHKVTELVSLQAASYHSLSTLQLTFLLQRSDLHVPFLSWIPPGRLLYTFTGHHHPLLSNPFIYFSWQWVKLFPYKCRKHLPLPLFHSKTMALLHSSSILIQFQCWKKYLHHPSHNYITFTLQHVYFYVINPRRSFHLLDSLLLPLSHSSVDFLHFPTSTCFDTSKWVLKNRRVSITYLG